MILVHVLVDGLEKILKIPHATRTDDGEWESRILNIISPDLAIRSLILRSRDAMAKKNGLTTIQVADGTQSRYYYYAGAAGGSKNDICRWTSASGVILRRRPSWKRSI